MPKDGPILAGLFENLSDVNVDHGRTVERLIIRRLSGVAAEAKLTGLRSEVVRSSDYQYVARLAVDLFGSAKQAEAYLKFSWSAAEALFAPGAHWAAVEKLAAAMLERGKVSGLISRRLIQRAIRDAASQGNG